MSETKHTPGPWFAVCDSSGKWWVSTVRKSNAIAEVYYSETDNPPEEEANAHLISAAPELLAACDAALAYVCNDNKSSEPCWCSDCRPTCTACVLRAAIAKARGGA